MLLSLTVKQHSMIKFKRADHIHICVPAQRLEEARRFYKEVIGLTEMTRPPELKDKGVWLKMGDIELHIGVERSRSPSIRHTAFEVEDIDAALKHLEDHGVPISPQTLLPGRRRFAFHDPFGNRMELLQMDVTDQ